MILITGAGGFIGGHLCQYFIDKGIPVRAVDIKPFNEWYQVHDKCENIHQNQKTIRHTTAYAFLSMKLLYMVYSPTQYYTSPHRKLALKPMLRYTSRYELVAYYEHFTGFMLYVIRN